MGGSLVTGAGQAVVFTSQMFPKISLEALLRIGSRLQAVRGSYAEKLSDRPSLMNVCIAKQHSLGAALPPWYVEVVRPSQWARAHILHR